MLQASEVKEAGRVSDKTDGNRCAACWCERTVDADAIRSDLAQPWVVRTGALYGRLPQRSVPCIRDGDGTDVAAHSNARRSVHLSADLHIRIIVYGLVDVTVQQQRRHHGGGKAADKLVRGKLVPEVVPTRNVTSRRNARTSA